MKIFRLLNTISCALAGAALLACNSSPKPIPFAATRSLTANSPTLTALETQIASKMNEQDALDTRMLELKEKIVAAPKDEILKRQQDRLEKETALCQAELAELVGRHQLESAKLLKKPDIEAHEKTVTKLTETVADRRKVLTEVR